MQEGEEGQGQAEPMSHAKKFWFVSMYSIKSSLRLLFGQWPGRRQEWKRTRRKEGGWNERCFGSRRRGHEGALDFGGVERGGIQDAAPVFWLKQLIGHCEFMNGFVGASGVGKEFQAQVSDIWDSLGKSKS